MAPLPIPSPHKEQLPEQEPPSKESPSKGPQIEHSPLKHSPLKHYPLKHSPFKHSPLKYSPLQYSPVEESPSKPEESGESPSKEPQSEQSPIKLSPIKLSPIKQSSSKNTPVGKGPFAQAKGLNPGVVPFKPDRRARPAPHPLRRPGSAFHAVTPHPIPVPHPQLSDPYQAAPYQAAPFISGFTPQHLYPQQPTGVALPAQAVYCPYPPTNYFGGVAVHPGAPGVTGLAPINPFEPSYTQQYGLLPGPAWVPTLPPTYLPPTGPPPTGPPPTCSSPAGHPPTGPPPTGPPPTGPPPNGLVPPRPPIQGHRHAASRIGPQAYLAKQSHAIKKKVEGHNLVTPTKLTTAVGGLREKDTPPLVVHGTRLGHGETAASKPKIVVTRDDSRDGTQTETKSDSAPETRSARPSQGKDLKTHAGPAKTHMPTWPPRRKEVAAEGPFGFPTSALPLWPGVLSWKAPESGKEENPQGEEEEESGQQLSPGSRELAMRPVAFLGLDRPPAEDSDNEEEGTQDDGSTLPAGPGAEVVVGPRGVTEAQLADQRAKAARGAAVAAGSRGLTEVQFAAQRAKATMERAAARERAKLRGPGKPTDAVVKANMAPEGRGKAPHKASRDPMQAFLVPWVSLDSSRDDAQASRPGRGTVHTTTRVINPPPGFDGLRPVTVVDHWSMIHGKRVSTSGQAQKTSNTASKKERFLLELATSRQRTGARGQQKPEKPAHPLGLGQPSTTAQKVPVPETTPSKDALVSPLAGLVGSSEGIAADRLPLARIQEYYPNGGPPNPARYIPIPDSWPSAYPLHPPERAAGSIGGRMTAEELARYRARVDRVFYSGGRFFGMTQEEAVHDVHVGRIWASYLDSLGLERADVEREYVRYTTAAGAPDVDEDGRRRLAASPFAHLTAEDVAAMPPHKVAGPLLDMLFRNLLLFRAEDVLPRGHQTWRSGFVSSHPAIFRSCGVIGDGRKGKEPAGRVEDEEGRAEDEEEEESREKGDEQARESTPPSTAKKGRKTKKRLLGYAC